MGLTYLICSINAQAQSRIAIVSVADTTFVHRHVGFTVITNFKDTLHVNFPIINYLESKLKFFLDDQYKISVVNLPDSVLKVKNGFFSSARTKKINQWIKASKELYDYVVVIDNMGLNENDRLIPENTSGLFSRMNGVAFYSTISFYAYRTSNLKPVEYYNQGGKFILPFEKFKLPEDKRSFTPEMMVMINDGFKFYLDTRVEHFLAKSYLCPQDRIDAKKAQTSSTK